MSEEWPEYLHEVEDVPPDIAEALARASPEARASYWRAQEQLREARAQSEAVRAEVERLAEQQRKRKRSFWRTLLEGAWWAALVLAGPFRRR